MGKPNSKLIEKPIFSRFGILEYRNRITIGASNFPLARDGMVMMFLLKGVLRSLDTGDIVLIYA